ncbi:ABC transporter ATP-binding protein [Listeria aquatica]|uniref:ABC transporter ATP-binding protein n=1 Tax=Listeria aquatica TaxID=1494960 RepID=A0A841ZJ50_9LIST|nr:ABC transporter ATP-binding protein [Listeria aquatica]MBC1520083.1 ABC transporter ATP-binding protein [Listeria aquatica]
MDIGCNKASVRFEENEHQTLENLSLSVKKGEKILLLGPSGCGKSTLLATLAGIIPKSIEAEVVGEVAAARQAGFLFQNPNEQFCMQTVGEEVAFSLENRAISFFEMEALIDHFLQLVGLDEKKETLIHELSGGMKQRLALACILALQPDVLFLDEPTAQLDPLGRREFAQLLGEIARDANQTMVVVEHDYEEYLDWLTRVIIFDRNGRIRYDGVPKQVLQTYREECLQLGIRLPTLFPFSWEEIVTSRKNPLAKNWNTFLSEKEKQEKNQETGESIFTSKKAIVGYKNKRILSDLSFTVHRGDWIVIAGENGAGKSTLIKSMAHLEPLLAGEFYFLNKNIKKWRDRSFYSQIGFVFQNPENQFVMNSVLEEIVLSGEKMKVKNEQLVKCVDEILRAFHLVHKKNLHPFSLSFGEKRRLSIATMLISQPDLLFLDEPTFGQDYQNEQEIFRYLKQLHQEGTTIIMISHDVEAIAKYASRLFVLHHGGLVYDGSPHTFFSKCESPEKFGLTFPLAYEYLQKAGRSIGK